MDKQKFLTVPGSFWPLNNFARDLSNFANIFHSSFELWDQFNCEWMFSWKCATNSYESARIDSSFSELGLQEKFRSQPSTKPYFCSNVKLLFKLTLTISYFVIIGQSENWFCMKYSDHCSSLIQLYLFALNGVKMCRLIKCFFL